MHHCCGLSDLYVRTKFPNKTSPVNDGIAALWSLLGECNIRGHSATKYLYSHSNTHRLSVPLIHRCSRAGELSLRTKSPSKMPRIDDGPAALWSLLEDVTHQSTEVLNSHAATATRIGFSCHEATAHRLVILMTSDHTRTLRVSAEPDPRLIV